MQLNIKEARENNITKVESSINIDLSLLSSLINSSKEELIIDMIKSNQIINSCILKYEVHNSCAISFIIVYNTI